jgi:tetratricopeptide (TPR) repeat protein
MVGKLGILALSAGVLAFLGGVYLFGRHQESSAPPHLIASQPAQTPEPATANRAEAERNRKLGREALERGDDDLAISYLSEALRLDPDNPDALRDRISASIGARKYQEAVQDCDRLLAVSTDESHRGKVFAFRSLSHHMLHRHFAAIRDASDAIRLGWARASVYDTRAAAYHCLGQRVRAIADASQAILLDPNLSYPYVTRGKAYAAQGLTEHAIQDFRRAVDLGETTAEPLWLLAGLEYGRDQWGDALSWARRAVERDPNNPFAYSLLALTYAKMGRPEMFRYYSDEFEKAKVRSGDRR